MTRNRDDFTTFQALRTGTTGVLAIVAVMVALGSSMAGHKQAALDRATNVAASALQFHATTTDVASAEVAGAKG